MHSWYVSLTITTGAVPHEAEALDRREREAAVGGRLARRDAELAASGGR